MVSHFRIIQEHRVWNVYSVNNLVELEEQYPTREQAERYVKKE
jgi:hypothetical protein